MRGFIDEAIVFEFSQGPEFFWIIALNRCSSFCNGMAPMTKAVELVAKKVSEGDTRRKDLLDMLHEAMEMDGDAAGERSRTAGK